MYLKIYCIFMSFTLITTNTVEVKLKQGKIIGQRQATISDGKHYYAFYGVPYARSPLGKYRFKNPKPAKKWKEPFDATVPYHGACAQPHIVHKEALFGYEDCLCLNIYTPQLRRDSNVKLKSVAIWIHGYAFSSGFSHIFGGDFLIDRDIIFITVSHRIGVFGFLKQDDSSSDENMGIKDIVIALKWIRTNIKQFGGDKEKITVMGNDSSATYLSLLLMTNYRKLFSKMILQSGSIFSASIFQGNYRIERERLIQNLRKMGPRDLETASTVDIVQASLKIYNNKEIMNFQRPVVPFTPTLSTKSNTSLFRITPDVFYKELGNKKKSKPILIGFNSQESITEVIPFLHNERYLKYFTPFFKYMVPFSDGCSYNYTDKFYKQIGSLIRKFYFNGNINEKSINSFIKYVTDLKKYPIWKFVKTHLSKVNSNVFLYKFNYVGGFNAAKATSLAGAKIKIKGASNGDEICYILKCEPLGEKYTKSNNITSDRDRFFIHRITKMWANFIETGDPSLTSRTGDIRWPPVTLKESNILLLDNVTNLMDPKSDEMTFAFWNNIYDSFYATPNCNNELREEL